MDHFGQIRYKGSLVQPTIAVITNVGDAHIENLGGTRQGTLRAKCEIFDHPAPAAWQCCAATMNCSTAWTCPLRPSAAAGANTAMSGSRTSSAGASTAWTAPSPLPAAATGCPSPPRGLHDLLRLHGRGHRRISGLSEQEIVEAVAGYVSTGSRMRRIRLPEDRLIIDDCYNANPQAMEAALEILADTACRRRVAVLGDMGELGPISRDAHLQVGRTTARLGAGRGDRHRPQGRRHRPDCRSLGAAFRRH